MNKDEWALIPPQDLRGNNNMRTWCDTLESMRKCYETRNFSGLLGLIEEQQDMANRMEQALEDQKSMRHYRDKAKEYKAEMKKELKALNKVLKKNGKEQKKENHWYG